MRVLVAFDTFKDSLDAEAACAIAADALRRVQPNWTIDCCPLTDGGEGFSRILGRAAGGESVTQTVTGPRGKQVRASFELVRVSTIPPACMTRLMLPRAPARDARVALVAMSTASGLALLPATERDPWRTTTTGTGELIEAAAQHGAAAIVLGIGGSATNDAGLGALDALGLHAIDARGGRVTPVCPEQWARVRGFTGHVSPDLPPLRIACDVTNPLLGPTGCTTVFGPQKGLRPEDGERLEHEVARVATLLTHYCDAPGDLVCCPGAGAAGGLGFGLAVAAGAELMSGTEFINAWLNLDERVAAADLVITGEGRFDATSAMGKGAGALAAMAARAGRRVHVFAGAAVAKPPHGVALHALSPSSLPLEEALRSTADRLRTAVAATFRSA